MDRELDFVCGEIVAVSDVPYKDKLKKVIVDVGRGEAVTIVTNASNVEVGKKVVVATSGTTLACGTKVETRVIAGVTSNGVLCDASMCGWHGGGVGAVAVLPESFHVGAAAPKTRPRLDGKTNEGGTGTSEGERKAKEEAERREKKAALAAKRAARDEKKAAKKEEESGK